MIMVVLPSAYYRTWVENIGHQSMVEYNSRSLISDNQI